MLKYMCIHKFIYLHIRYKTIAIKIVVLYIETYAIEIRLLDIAGERVDHLQHAVALLRLLLVAALKGGRGLLPLGILA